MYVTRWCHSLCFVSIVCVSVYIYKLLLCFVNSVIVNFCKWMVYILVAPQFVLFVFLGLVLVYVFIMYLVPES